MENSTCLRELIENNRIYQCLTDKLELNSDSLNCSWNEISKKVHLNENMLHALVISYDETQVFPEEDFLNASTEEILRYLNYSHNYYTKRKLPEIEQTIQHLYASYQESHQLLVILGLFFMDYKKKLESHIRFEEEKFFPYIETLMKISKNHSDAGEILNCLNSFSAKQFIESHTDVETELQEVRKTILNYSDDEKAPLPYRIFLNQLQNFENDLCNHALIEDQILIPKVIEMEARLLKRANGILQHPAG